MNFHFNRYLKRKLYEIYLQSVIFFFPRVFIRNGREKKKKNTRRKKFASFCKTLHPINVKTLKRLPDYLTGLLSFSSFNISVFILSFGENLFSSFLCLQVPGEEKKNTFIRFTYCWGIYCTMMSTSNKTKFFFLFAQSLIEKYSLVLKKLRNNSLNIKSYQETFLSYESMLIR